MDFDKELVALLAERARIYWEKKEEEKDGKDQ